MLDANAFLSQPQYIVRYIGVVMEDARQVDGIWYARERGSIRRLGLQNEVKVAHQVEAGEPIEGIRQWFQATS